MPQEEQVEGGTTEKRQGANIGQESLAMLPKMRKKGLRMEAICTKQKRGERTQETAQNGFEKIRETARQKWEDFQRAMKEQVSSSNIENKEHVRLKKEHVKPE